MKYLFEKGDKNPLWKGNKVGYSSQHSWLKRNFGNPLKCEQCGKLGAKNKGNKWDIQWALLKGCKYERLFAPHVFFHKHGLSLDTHGLVS